jgi:hypothetical protein
MFRVFDDTPPVTRVTLQTLAGKGSSTRGRVRLDHAYGRTVGSTVLAVSGALELAVIDFQLESVHGVIAVAGQNLVGLVNGLVDHLTPDQRAELAATLEAA